MGQFPGQNSILVMDNAPVHHGGRIEDLCNNVGVLLVYLPAYSPNMNPIEKVFLVLKSRLKWEMLLTGTDDNPDIIKDFLPEFVNDELMAALFQGSGY
jgi:transposase